MGEAGLITKFLKWLVKGASDVVSKVGSKLSLKTISKVGLGGFVAYSIYDGFTMFRDFLKDLVDPFIPWPVTDTQINFVIVLLVAGFVVALVYWFRRRP